MLGEKIGEFQGKVTSQRVLPSDGPAPKVEVSFEVSGSVLGINATYMGTYWSVVRPDGALYGECPDQGMLMTEDGDLATWTGAGAGRFTGRGSAVSYRGAIYHQTSSEKLAQLNGLAVVFEWEVDENGNAHSQLWEWK